MLLLQIALPNNERAAGAKVIQGDGLEVKHDGYYFYRSRDDINYKRISQPVLQPVSTNTDVKNRDKGKS